ncbi:hypothetical protein J1605_012965 [Eschrichtius robustus]|uniref:Uncharacterized protein n=1 Tax=Eschrichtius robustus TaxID=9764 RepID=A0AB34GHL2_ESCRO|nr:hypothetical protein J1605_012965 [Eschrichtius robustus]
MRLECSEGCPTQLLPERLQLGLRQARATSCSGAAVCQEAARPGLTLLVLGGQADSAHSRAAAPSSRLLCALDGGGLIGFPRYHRHSQLTERTFPHTCWMAQIWGASMRGEKPKTGRGEAARLRCAPKFTPSIPGGPQRQGSQAAVARVALLVLGLRTRGSRGRSAAERCPKLGKQRAEPLDGEERAGAPGAWVPEGARGPLWTGSHAPGAAAASRSHGPARGQQVSLPRGRPGRGPKG